MPYCPNPDCPYRKRFGESAEFRSEIITCSDCGASLSEKDILGPAPKAAKKRIMFALTDMNKRILWTVILVAFWHILSHLSLPGIDYDVLSQKGLAVERALSRFTIFSLGLIPYVGAYVLVEMLALFIQPLKRWRQEGNYEGRARLVTAARWTTLLIAIFHGNALLTSMASMADGQMFIDKSLGFRALLLLTLVTGTFLTVLIADLISSKGIGHGVSILFLTYDISSLPRTVSRLFTLAKEDSIVTQFVAPLVMLIGFIILIIMVEKIVRRIPMRNGDGEAIIVPIKLTTAGNVPADWAGWFVGIPMIILAAYPPEMQSGQHVLQWMVNTMAAGSSVRTLVYGIFIVLFYYVFTAFFHNPKKIARFVSGQAENGSSSSDSVLAMDRSLEGMALIGSLYLFLLASAQDALWKWSGVPLLIDGLTLLLVVCIALDVMNEVTLRWQADSLVKIAELHEPWKAGMLQSLLQEKSIPCVIRGYHHRALLYFFGPYIEMTVFVSSEHAEAAQVIVQQRLRLA